jgi:hypothetical protein
MKTNLHFHEALAWQGAKAPQYRDISSLRSAARQDASTLEDTVHSWGT